MRRERGKFSEFSKISSSWRRVSSESCVFLYFVCSCISLAHFSVVEIRDYSQSNKEMACATRQGYLHNGGC